MNRIGYQFMIWLSLCVLLLSISCIQYQKGKVLFQDALNGKVQPGWRVAPDNFVVHPVYGKVYQLESEKFLENPPWVGDKTWRNYRAEIEILPTGGHWVGLDCHVQNDGSSGFNIQFFTFDTTHQIALEALSFEGGNKEGAAAWKLWPVSQKFPVIEKDTWIKFRIDVGETIVNAYINDDTEPVFTVYDMPYSKGGVRFFSYHTGKAYLRNFRVTALSKKDVQPILKDVWHKVRDQNIIREWEITSPQPSEFGLDSLPAELNIPDMKWIKAKTDKRGVLNVGALFPKQNRQGTVFARKTVLSESDKIQKAWVTYTDRCTIWCNGKQVFKGPKRGWNDPEANHDCRLKPDQFEIELPIKQGENTVYLRSEVTENWGWGFWMRLE
jgi:hypothetical protein